METKKHTEWDELYTLVRGYADASRADEVKGGGDSTDIDVIEAQLDLAHAQLVRLHRTGEARIRMSILRRWLCVRRWRRDRLWLKRGPHHSCERNKTQAVTP
jgi:hypothetical protein